MKIVEQNKLKLIFCGFGCWAMLKLHFSIA